jgi:hypothetical protein
MSAWYSASRSISTAEKPSRRAASPVMPVPAKQSSTVPPGGVTSRHSQRIRARGLTVGCLDPARSALLALAL